MASRLKDILAGLLTGLVSSTFSTLFVWFGSRQVGRDPEVDFMEVAMVPQRDGALDERPSREAVATGIATHQGADVMWATVFFGALRPALGWNARTATVTLGLPWAVGTAAAEYYVFLPWVQPWLRMQVPFWTAAGVHVSSSAAYGVYPWVRGLLDGTTEEGRTAAKTTAFGMGACLAALAGLRWLSRRGHDPRWPGVDADAYDREFLYLMAGHHEAGLELAELAARRAEHDELRALGRLMVAQHVAELELMHDWWRGWFDGDIPPLSPVDREQMYGMPAPEEVGELRGLSGADLDRRFVALMVPHHLGAVRMSNDAWERARDPRVRLFADGIRHSQRGQIERMSAHA